MASHRGPRRPGPARNRPLPKGQTPRHQSDGDRQHTDQSPTPSTQTTPSPRPRAGVPLPVAMKTSGTPAQGRGDERMASHQGLRRPGSARDGPLPKGQAPRHRSDGDRQRIDQSPTPSTQTTPSPRPRAGVPLPDVMKTSGTPAQGRGDDRNGIPSGAQKAGPSAQWPAPKRQTLRHRSDGDRQHTGQRLTTSTPTTPSPRPRAGVPLPDVMKNSGTPAQGRGDDRDGIPFGAQQKAGLSARRPASQAAGAPPPDRRRSATHRPKPDAIHANHPVTPASSRGPASWCDEDQRDPSSGPG
jgi:hypothetical protein